MRDKKDSKRTQAGVQVYEKILAYIGYAVIITLLVSVIVVSSFSS